MTLRARIPRVLALAVALLLLAAGSAAADRAAYDRVSAAYANSGGQLDPCSFSQEDLQGALDGIPEAFKDVVPDLRRAIEDGIAAHRAGDCRGIEPDGGASATTQTPPPSTTPTVPTTPETTATPPATETPGATPPAATPPAATPGQVTTTPGVEQPGVKRDKKPLIAGAAALGALLLALLLLWGWARWRGWDPPWLARTRHAWGEAGFRATTTWSEFTDWLRLGR